MAARDTGPIGTGIPSSRQTASIPATDKERNSAEYIHRARPVIRTRLAQAGPRLGWLLTELLR